MAEEKGDQRVVRTRAAEAVVRQAMRGSVMIG